MPALLRTTSQGLPVVWRAQNQTLELAAGALRRLFGGQHGSNTGKAQLGEEHRISPSSWCAELTTAGASNAREQTLSALLTFRERHENWESMESAARLQLLVG